MGYCNSPNSPYHHPLYPPGPTPEVESGKHHLVVVLLSLVGVGRQEGIEL